MPANRLHTHLWRLLLVACFTVTGLLASETHGVVKAGGLPVPGATVTATQADKKVVTSTDDAGFYSFPELADGTWTLTVEALGFVTARKEVGVIAGIPGPEWDLNTRPWMPSPILPSRKLRQRRRRLPRPRQPQLAKRSQPRPQLPLQQHLPRQRRPRRRVAAAVARMDKDAAGMAKAATVDVRL